MHVLHHDTRYVHSDHPCNFLIHSSPSLLLHFAPEPRIFFLFFPSSPSSLFVYNSVLPSPCWGGFSVSTPQSWLFSPSYGLSNVNSNTLHCTTPRRWWIHKHVQVTLVLRVPCMIHGRMSINKHLITICCLSELATRDCYSEEFSIIMDLRNSLSYGFQNTALVKNYATVGLLVLLDENNSENEF